MDRAFSFENINILVIGDIMLDIYKYGHISRISPEAPVPIVQITHRETAMGGAANVAANLRAIGCNVELAGYIGTDTGGKQLRLKLCERSIGQNCVIDSIAPTISKTRILADKQHIIRYDNDSAMDTPIHREMHESLLISRLQAMVKMEQFDAVIVSNYNKGAISADIMSVIKALFYCPVLCDIKPQNADLFEGVFCITPNLAEAKQLVDNTDSMSLRDLAITIKNRFKLSILVITMSERGTFLLDQDNKSHIFNAHIMADFSRQLDVTGAGDTVLSTIAACIAKGYSSVDAAMISNLAAGVVVGKTGTATCNIEELNNAYFQL